MPERRARLAPSRLREDLAWVGYRALASQADGARERIGPEGGGAAGTIALPRGAGRVTLVKIPFKPRGLGGHRPSASGTPGKKGRAQQRMS